MPGERGVPIPEHRLAACTEDVVAGLGRHVEAFGDGQALLLHPVHSRSAPPGIPGQRMLDGLPVAQELCEDQGVFHGQATALAHHRRAGVGGVSDENGAGGVPSRLLDPFDSRAVNLLIIVETRQVILDRGAEMAEPLPETLEPALPRVQLPLMGDIREPAGLAVTDRAQAEEAPVVQPELNAGPTPAR